MMKILSTNVDEAGEQAVVALGKDLCNVGEAALGIIWVPSF